MRPPLSLSIPNPRIAIVGATGAFGRELLMLMEERSFGLSHLSLVASPRSAGMVVLCREREYAVQDLAGFDFAGIDIAFFLAGAPVSREWARRATSAGALVIDCSGAFSADPEVPLVAPLFNARELGRWPRSGIIAIPSSASLQLARVLSPIHRRYGLKRVAVTLCQAASGDGMKGIRELEDSILAALAAPIAPPPREAPSSDKALGFNVIPQTGYAGEDGFTLEERTLSLEVRKLLSLPELDLTATALRVPVRTGHGETVYAETEHPVDRDKLVAALRASEELRVHDSKSPARGPSPLLIEPRDQVHVGRIRMAPSNARGLWCWIVADDLRAGVALSAIRVAERIAEAPVSRRPAAAPQLSLR